MDELQQLKIWAGIVPQQQTAWSSGEGQRLGGPLMFDRVPPPRETVAEDEIINEESFKSPQHMLTYVLDRLRLSIYNYNDDPDQDAYYVVQDVESILDTIDR